MTWALGYLIVGWLICEFVVWATRRYRNPLRMDGGTFLVVITLWPVLLVLVGLAFGLKLLRHRENRS